MDLYQYLHDRTHDILTDAEQAVRRSHLEHYEKEGPDHLHQRLKALLVLTTRAIKERNLGPMIAHATTVAHDRYTAGYDLAEVQSAFNALEEVIWRRVVQDFPPSEYAQALGLVGTVLGSGKDALARRYVTLASKSRAPSFDLRSLFTGTEA